MKNIPLYPGHGTAVGFSCQTWIARKINEYLHPGLYFCWFSKRFNAMFNGDDSNPMWIYLILDRAVEQGAYNNAKVKDVKSNLLYAVDKELRAAGRATDIPAAMAAIRSAPIKCYTPQLWKVKLNRIAGRYVGVHQYRDEFKITNLKANEFEIIIE